MPLPRCASTMPVPDSPTPSPIPEPVAGTGRRIPLVAVAGTLAVLALAGLLVRAVLDSGSDHTGSTGGNGAPATPPASGPSPDPNALPASWAGTWVGTGPGNPNGNYSFGLHTDSYKVTLTLHAGRLGQLVGQQAATSMTRTTARTTAAPSHLS